MPLVSQGPESAQGSFLKPRESCRINSWLSHLEKRKDAIRSFCAEEKGKSMCPSHTGVFDTAI